ncbi:nuclear transport factor 2 family protein [Streptomyces sp. NPDC001889]
MPLLPDAGHIPTTEELAEIDAWFAAYDGYSARREIERMADVAVFPLNLVSDDSQGNGAAAQWDRARFVETMTQVMGGGDEDITFESTRTPVFLSPAMVIVFTDSAMTAGGHTQRLRYADILIKRDGAWAFQTMLQGGWGDNLH